VLQSVSGRCFRQSLRCAVSVMSRYLGLLQGSAKRKQGTHMKLKKKTAFVTGAGRGIGEAIALKLASEGADVHVSDIDLASAGHTAAQIEQLGGKAWAVALDVTDYEACVTAIGTAVAAGRLDILVNNAGWDKTEPFLESQPATWARVVAINYMGVVHGCHAVLPHFVAQGAGRIVNIGSDAGRVGSTGEAVYSGAKGGVIAFTKTVAREMARSGIQLNVVCPGPTETPLVMEIAQATPKLVASLERAIPLGRMGKPDEVADAVAFLASDEARFITGQTLSVSGGLTMM
jgi:2-hydroxycyclohexanecarboxyl-CoA dehydrogenase